MTPASRQTRAERGAVGTLVALLVGAFVITGLLAWSVDAGQVFWERRQTQVAADAAALALAQSCAKSNCVSGADNLAGLVTANTVNNGTRTHTIERQCKRNWLGGTLPICSSTPSVSELRECPPVPTGLSSLLPMVEVRVQANENGSPGISNPFARANPAATATSSVISCARAAWGTPTAAAARAPFTISVCEWQTYTGGGLVYVAQPPAGAWPGYGGSGQPPYPLPAGGINTVGREQIIYLHDQSNALGCHRNGKDTSGGFGYLDKGAADCQPTIATSNNTDYWAEISTGSSAPNECRSRMDEYWLSGPTIDIPIFDCLVTSSSMPASVPSSCDPTGGGGAKTWYHIVGVARFYVSGYRIGGSEARPSRVSGAIPCGNPDRCVSGWFLQGVLSAPNSSIVPPSPTNPGFGLSAVIAAG